MAMSNHQFEIYPSSAAMFAVCDPYNLPILVIIINHMVKEKNAKDFIDQSCSQPSLILNSI